MHNSQLKEIRSALYCRICELLRSSHQVDSAVLFGSAAALHLGTNERGTWGVGDFDFHLITRNPEAFESLGWEKEFYDYRYCFHATRPATGGARKITIVCSEAQLDLVVVSVRSMWIASIALKLGLPKRIPVLRGALNEMATCLHSGYHFVKGESKWGKLYNRVFQLPGVRLSKDEVRRLADAFLVDALWVYQKINSGEMVAAQHALHCRLVDTNLKLWREWRMRKGLPVPSFGLGRKAEFIATLGEQELFSLARLPQSGDLRFYTAFILRGMTNLMRELEPQWKIPLSMQILLKSYQT